MKKKFGSLLFSSIGPIHYHILTPKGVDLLFYFNFKILNMDNNLFPNNPTFHQHTRLYYSLMILACEWLKGCENNPNFIKMLSVQLNPPLEIHFFNQVLNWIELHEASFGRFCFNLKGLGLRVLLALFSSLHGGLLNFVPFARNLRCFKYTRMLLVNIPKLGEFGDHLKVDKQYDSIFMKGQQGWTVGD